jgi:hypothetical protein
MIYVKSILGGLAALLLSFVFFIIWLSRLAPKGGTVGFTPSHLLLPRVVLIESAIFAPGFGIAWMLLSS